MTPEDKRKVGPSDVAALLGLSPYATPLSVYARVVGEAVEDKPTPAMLRGTVLEGPVLDMYAIREKVELQRAVSLRDASRPWFRVSMDALALAPQHGARVVEAKTAGMEQAPQWGEDGTDWVPQGYLLQVQLYLHVGLRLGAVEEDTAHLAALVAGDLRVYPIRYSPRIGQAAMEALERFWRDHVEPRRPPPATTPADVEAVGRLYRRSTEAHRDYSALPPEEQWVVDEYLRAHAEAKRAEEYRRACEARVKEVVGYAEGVRGLPEGLGYHRLDWKTEKARREVDWQAVVAAMSEASGMEAGVVRAIIARHTKEQEPRRPLTPRTTKHTAGDGQQKG